MEIIIGKTAGFCYGVKNAVEKSTEELKKEKELCCLGEIVHNKQVVQELEQQGMEFIENLQENITKKKTVIRAHGVSKKIYDDAKKEGIDLIDLTCPMVLKIHKIVEQDELDGYFIFVIGSKNHPETVGTIGFCNNQYFIIENELDIDNAIEALKKSGRAKVAVVVQTTFSLEKFNELLEKIKLKLGSFELKVTNTICNATRTRQEETQELSKNVDFMIIIGGRNSSNTKKLFEIANKNCANTICIETYNELKLDEIKKFEKVGIMAGASTPQQSIQNVVDFLKNT